MPFIWYFHVENNGKLCTWFDKLEFSFLLFPFMEKLYPPVCSTLPASLQAQGWAVGLCSLPVGLNRGVTRVLYPLTLGV